MVTRRRHVIKVIADQAKRAGLDWAEDREGGRHTIFSLDGLMIPIPRHPDIDVRTAERIYKECEPKLGRRWWK